MRRKSAKDLEIAALAAAQYGVVSRAQLVHAGLTHEDVDRRMRAGRLLARPFTWRQIDEKPRGVAAMTPKA